MRSYEKSFEEFLNAGSNGLTEEEKLSKRWDEIFHTFIVRNVYPQLKNSLLVVFGFIVLMIFLNVMSSGNANPNLMALLALGVAFSAFYFLFLFFTFIAVKDVNDKNSPLKFYEEIDGSNWGNELFMGYNNLMNLYPDEYKAHFIDVEKHRNL